MTASLPTPTDPSLDAYEAWLRRRGAGAGTIAQYRRHASHIVEGDDIFERLSDRSLSPKYRRLCRAAAKSFARFQKSVANEGETKKIEKHIEELEEVRLPAPVRKTAKVPLSKEAWRALREAIDEASIKEPVRAVLGLMANRGLRCGDVLRLKKSDVKDALKTGILSYVAKGERRLEFGVLKSYRGYLEILERAFVGTKASAVCDLITPRAASYRKMAAARQMIARVLCQVGDDVGEEDLGVDPEELHPHKLRRTYATIYYEACGKDPMKLKNHMQWASLETAMSYVDHTKREELDDIADEMLADED